MASPAQHLALLHALGIVEPEVPAEPESSEDAVPDFDGGVRQPAPPPSDPEFEHGQTVLEILQRANWGGPW